MESIALAIIIAVNIDDNDGDDEAIFISA